MDATTALAIYRAEKDKALRERRVSHVQLMAEAQEAFRKMLADAQLARKGGRPKGSTNAATAAPPAAPAAPAIPPGKLILKTSKAASPPKGVEKVTAPSSAVAKAPKAAKVASTRTPQRATAKRTSTKKAATAKGRVVAKSAKHAAAPAARSGSAKKPKAGKQAAAQERKAKSRKR